MQNGIKMNKLKSFIVKLNKHGSHPHSTYAQRGKGGVKPNACDFLQGGRGRFKVPYGCKKIFFWTTKSQDFTFFVQKKLLHCHLLLCIKQCKPALSYK